MPRESLFAVEYGAIASVFQCIVDEVDAVIGVTTQQLQRVLLLVEYLQFMLAHLIESEQQLLPPAADSTRQLRHQIMNFL